MMTVPHILCHLSTYTLQTIRPSSPTNQNSSQKPGPAPPALPPGAMSTTTCNDTYSNKSWCIIIQGTSPLWGIDWMKGSPHPYLRQQPNTEPIVLKSAVWRDFRSPHPHLSCLTLSTLSLVINNPSNTLEKSLGGSLSGLHTMQTGLSLLIWYLSLSRTSLTSAPHWVGLTTFYEACLMHVCLFRFVCT